MAMKKESNSYIIIYSVVMVVIVALALAFTSESLKAPKQANAQIDKMQQILRSVNLTPDKSKVIDTYKSVILTEALISTETGDIVKEFTGDDRIKSEAFAMNTNNQFKFIRNHSASTLPIYFAKVDEVKKYIVPLNGNGLWNIIWGYISIDADGFTVYGTDFGNAGETPGLGAEISTKKFSERFVGKHIGSLEKGIVGIAVMKKGQIDPNRREQVDGITGGTLTSNGVNEMIAFCLKAYEPFFMKIATENKELNPQSNNQKDTPSIIEEQKESL